MASSKSVGGAWLVSISGAGLAMVIGGALGEAEAAVVCGAAGIAI